MPGLRCPHLRCAARPLLARPDRRLRSRPKHTRPRPFARRPRLRARRKSQAGWALPRRQHGLASLVCALRPSEAPPRWSGRRARVWDAGRRSLGVISCSRSTEPCGAGPASAPCRRSRRSTATRSRCAGASPALASRSSSSWWCRGSCRSARASCRSEPGRQAPTRAKAIEPAVCIYGDAHAYTQGLGPTGSHATRASSAPASVSLASDGARSEVRAEVQAKRRDLVLIEARPKGCVGGKQVVKIVERGRGCREEVGDLRSAFLTAPRKRRTQPACNYADRT